VVLAKDPSNKADLCYNAKTDLRLRLLSETKLVISNAGHGSRYAPMGVPESVPVEAYKCLCRGVSRSRLFFFRVRVRFRTVFGKPDDPE
jgi:hypothetical protein